MKYDHQKIERKWQKKWQQEGLYRTEMDEQRPKYYILDMFPYPSGSGLHVGHPKGYIATDIVARKKMMEGRAVLHPMGWDAFGLPAENYALKNHEHPIISTRKNIEVFKKQLQILGFSYDWEREINTTDPEFYRWTQWCFVKLFESYFDQEMGRARPIEELIAKRFGSGTPPGGDFRCSTASNDHHRTTSTAQDRSSGAPRKSSARESAGDVVISYDDLTTEQKREIDGERLAFEDFAPINWCPSCKTGLANEDLEDGKCERCGSEIELKPMRQWKIRITKYADRLLKDLELLPDWEEFIKTMQVNWIGRSEGAEVEFQLSGDFRRCPSPSDPHCTLSTAQDCLTCASGKSLKYNKTLELKSLGNKSNSGQVALEEVRVFTTRVDTLFGCTYVVLAPEKAAALFGEFRCCPSPTDPHRTFSTTRDRSVRAPRNSLKYRHSQSQFLIENWEEVEAYIKRAEQRSELERTDATKEKTGVELKGVVAINPVNGEKVPVWIGDYVLGGYGTGAIMAVPAHDERDWEFAKKYNLPIREVVKSEQGQGAGEPGQEQALTEDGVLVNSGKYTGLTSAQARQKITADLAKEGVGKKTVHYKLQDWVFSRQRYWGEPIPVVHCGKCGVVAVPEAELPVRLPEVEAYEPSGTGESPLAKISEWVEVKCPRCGGVAARETNTMPQWAGSSWYYLRFMDPGNKRQLVAPAQEKYWSPVDFYVGGAEHATRHLIYARFWHKFLYDLGVVSTVEPFQKLKHVGLILAEDGRKMSKRWNNVINPDEIVERFGADSMRLYEMFMAPFSQASSWNTQGVVGVRKFVEKVWQLQEKVEREQEPGKPGKNGGEALVNPAVKTTTTALLHQTIRKVGTDIDNFKLNTAVSAMMILVNKLTEEKAIARDDFRRLVQILAPFAPHVAEELWQNLGEKESVFKTAWPEYDEQLAQDEAMTIAVQVNGKVRGELVVAAALVADQEKVTVAAREVERVLPFLEGREVRRVIYVPGKIVNFVVN
jgi:leucyl-tRNA synthetase